MLALLFLNFCLSLSHAQNPLDESAIKKVIDGIQTQAPVNTNPPPPPPTVYPELPPQAPAPNANPTSSAPGAPAPGAPIAASVPSGAPGPTGTEVIDAAKATSGKYEEYQSICRSHEYDNIPYRPVEIKQARIEIFKKRAQKSPEGIAGHLPLLHELLQQGDMNSFNTLSTELKNKKSSPRDNDVLNALIFLANRNPRSAINALLKALTDDEKNEFIMTMLAQAYIADANFYEAGTIYEDLNKQHKNKYLVEHCEALVGNSLNADGEKVCLEAAGKFPENPFPLLFTGISHRERENIPTAIAFFKKSIKVKPTEMGATCLAEAYFIQNKFAEAATAFSQSLEVNPASARATLGMAWAHLKAKDYEQSLGAFKRACKLGTRFQGEMRKAYKFLTDEKIISAKKFLELAESCGG